MIVLYKNGEKADVPYCYALRLMEQGKAIAAPKPARKQKAAKEPERG